MLPGGKAQRLACLLQHPGAVRPVRAWEGRMGAATGVGRELGSACGAVPALAGRAAGGASYPHFTQCGPCRAGHLWGRAPPWCLRPQHHGGCVQDLLGARGRRWRTPPSQGLLITLPCARGDWDTETQKDAVQSQSSLNSGDYFSKDVLQCSLILNHHVQLHLPLHHTFQQPHFTDLTPVLLFLQGECQRFLQDDSQEPGMTSSYVSSHFRKPRGISRFKNCCKTDGYKPFPDLDQKS